VFGRLIVGSRGSVAGTVYGTIVVLSALTAGAAFKHSLGHLAEIVATSVVVLWIAHVYAHGIAESLEQNRRLTTGELIAIAGRELAIPLAAVLPLVALLLGASHEIRDDTAVWVAIGVGIATLVAQGLRYARLKRMGFRGTSLSVLLNLALGLTIVAIKVYVAH